jgi:adenylate cyclase
MRNDRVRFLFIDDEDLILSALRRALRREAYDVTFTNDPEDALRIVVEEEIDVVISDHSMPHMTGVEFFAILRRLHDHVIRVMMTGQSDREVTIRAINDGQVQRFIEKPWNNDELRTILTRIDSEVRLRHKAAQIAANAKSGSPRPYPSILRDATGAVGIRSESA